MTAARHAWQRALDILHELGHPDAQQVRTKLQLHDLVSHKVLHRGDAYAVRPR